MTRPFVLSGPVWLPLLAACSSLYREGLQSQGPAAPPPATERLDLPARGTEVRALVGGQWLEARYSGRRADSLVLRFATAERAYAITAVDTLWAHRGSAGDGAFLGLVAGSLVGAVAFGARQGAPEYAIAGALLFALPGVVVGAGLGAAASEWRQVLPAQPARSDPRRDAPAAPPQAVAQVVAAPLDRVPIGAALRVRLLGGRRLEGTLMSADTAGAIMNVYGVERFVAMTSIDSVWTWRAAGDASMKVIGLAAGAAVGMLAMARGRRSCVEECDLFWALPVGALAGGLAGGLISAGLSEGSWIPVWPGTATGER